MATLNKSYTPEQINDARRLFSTIQRLPESRQPICIAVVTAYMDGFLAGQGIHSQDKQEQDSAPELVEQ